MKIEVPIITSTVSIGEILEWVKRSTQTIGFGKCGVEFCIQDGIIMSYEPIYRPHIRPRQIISDDLPHHAIDDSYSVIAEAVENGKAEPGEAPRYEPPQRGN